MKMTTEEAFVKVLQRHGIAHACGLQGVVARATEDLRQALATAIDDQMTNRRTTLIEAMKKPGAVAGIDPADMAGG